MEKPTCITKPSNPPAKEVKLEAETVIEILKTLDGLKKKLQVLLKQ